MGKRTLSDELGPDQLPSDSIPNPRILEAILRIIRTLLWFLDRTPRAPVDSRHARPDDVTTLLADIPKIIGQEDADEDDP